VYYDGSHGVKLSLIDPEYGTQSPQKETNMFTKIKSIVSRTTVDMTPQQAHTATDAGVATGILTVSTVSSVVMGKVFAGTMLAGFYHVSAIVTGTAAVGCAGVALYNVGSGVVTGVKRAMNTPLGVTIVPASDVEVVS
jgi:hypothetical protein